MKIVNTFDNTEYEAIQYTGSNFLEIEKFIKENYNLTMSTINPNMYVIDLEYPNEESRINANDYVIRTIGKAPLYSVIDAEIFECRFSLVV